MNPVADLHPRAEKIFKIATRTLFVALVLGVLTTYRSIRCEAERYAGSEPVANAETGAEAARGPGGVVSVPDRGATSMRVPGEPISDLLTAFETGDPGLVRLETSHERETFASWRSARSRPTDGGIAFFRQPSGRRADEREFRVACGGSGGSGVIKLRMLGGRWRVVEIERSGEQARRTDAARALIERELRSRTGRSRGSRK